MLPSALRRSYNKRHAPLDGSFFLIERTRLSNHSGTYKLSKIALQVNIAFASFFITTPTETVTSGSVTVQKYLFSFFRKLTYIIQYDHEDKDILILMFFTICHYVPTDPSARMQATLMLPSAFRRSYNKHVMLLSMGRSF